MSEHRSALHNGSALHNSSAEQNSSAPHGRAARHGRPAAHGGSERPAGSAAHGSPAPQDRSALLSQRAAVILLLGVLTAIGAGVLTCFNGGTLPSAALVGGAAFGAGVTFFHTVID
ncbi:hypothetical protein ACWD6P_18765 [Streptomyces sp. NPDC002446]